MAQAQLSGQLGRQQGSSSRALEHSERWSIPRPLRTAGARISGPRNRTRLNRRSKRLTSHAVLLFSRMMERLVEAEPGAGDCEVFTFDVNRVESARRALWANSEFEATADLLKLAGSPARLRILLSLAVGELCVCDLARVLGLSVSATSNQLQTMRRAGLIKFRKDGKLAFYSLRRPKLLELVNQAHEMATVAELR